MSEENDSEKTEEPTHRKLEEAAKRGDVAKSQEISAWFVMLGAAMCIGLMGNSSAGTIMHALKIFLAAPDQIPMDRDHLRAMVLRCAEGVAGWLVLAGWLFCFCCAWKFLCM